MDFEKLYKTDVTKHIEKKGRFSYLSWVFAVREFRKACPSGTWAIKEYGESGQPYCQTDSGCFVCVHVMPDVDKPTVSFTQVHPVLDHANKTVKEPNAFQVNTSIQRCLVKAIALATGIGLHIYAGEDLPEEDKQFKTKEAATLDDFATQVKLFSSIESLQKWEKENTALIKQSLSAADCKKLRTIVNEQADKITSNKDVPLFEESNPEGTK